MLHDRRRFIAGLAAAALSAATARAQAPRSSGKPAQVALLYETTAAKASGINEFIDIMRGLGWVEGRNIVYDRVYADDDETRLPALAAALVSRSPDVIRTVSGSATLAVLARTRTIPIVFNAANSPVENGLVKSLARPGGNVTGISNIGWELGGKRLQLLKQVMPKLARVGVLVNPTRTESLREQKLIEQAGTTLGVKIVPALVKETRELDAAFALLAKNRVEAVLTTHSLFFLDQRKRILELAATRRLPVIGHRSQFVDDGALLSYSSMLAEQVRRSSAMIDKILKGAKPADIPVEQPTLFELVVNKKTAKTLGIKFPGETMIQATRVIE